MIQACRSGVGLHRIGAAGTGFDDFVGDVVDDGDIVAETASH